MAIGTILFTLSHQAMEALLKYIAEFFCQHHLHQWPSMTIDLWQPLFVFMTSTLYRDPWISRWSFQVTVGCVGWHLYVLNGMLIAVALLHCHTHPQHFCQIRHSSSSCKTNLSSAQPRLISDHCSALDLHIYEFHIISNDNYVARCTQQLTVDPMQSSFACPAIPHRTIKKINQKLHECCTAKLH